MVGIVLNTIDLKRFDKVSLALYALMGWLVVVAMKAIIATLPPLGLGLLTAGGGGSGDYRLYAVEEDAPDFYRWLFGSEEPLPVKRHRRECGRSPPEPPPAPSGGVLPAWDRSTQTPFGSEEPLPVKALPERTSLQRRAKARLAAGGPSSAKNRSARS